METVKKTRRPYKRTVPTVKDRADMIAFIRDSCYKKLPLYESDIYKRFGTTKALQKLLEKSVIKTTSKTDVYFWLMDKKIDLQKLAADLWRNNGHEKPAAGKSAQLQLDAGSNGILTQLLNDESTITVDKKHYEALQLDIVMMKEKTLSIVADGFTRIDRYAVPAEKIRIFLTDYINSRL